MLPALAVLAICCSSGNNARAPRTHALACDSSRRVRDYIDRIANLASHAGRSDDLPRKEAVTISLQLAGDGSVSSASVRKATSEAAALWGLSALRAAAPFPRPWPDVSPCVVGQPFMVILVSLGPADASESSIRGSTRPEPGS